MSATSNEERKTALQGQAIEWLVKMRDDQVTAQELNAFADWLAEDPSHSQAYTASENLFNDMIAASPGLAPPNQTTHQFNAPKKATVRPLKRPHPLSPYPIQTSRVWLRS